MGDALRALLIDDSEEDSELLIHYLRHNGVDVSWERVDTAEALRAALARQSWDIALCDYMMPLLKGPEALEIVRAAVPDLPAIVISGQVGEEYAVEVMRAGARDYVRKDNLARLVPLIERELLDAEVRDRQRRAAAALRMTESWLHVAVQSGALGLFSYEPRTCAVFLSPQWKANLGYAPEEIPDRIEEFESRLHPDDRDRTLADRAAQLTAGGVFAEREFRLRHKDGSYRWVLSRSTTQTDESGAVCRLLGCNLDITERKEAEARLAEQAALLDLAHDAIIVRDLRCRIRFWNRGAERKYGWSAAEAQGQVVNDLLQTVFSTSHEAMEAALHQQGECEAELTQTRRDGSRLVVLSRQSLQRDAQGTPIAVLEVNRDITDRKRAEAALCESEARFRLYYDLGLIGMAITSPRKGWLQCNDYLCVLLGYTREELTTRTWAELTHPADLAADEAQFGRVLAGEIDGYTLDKRFVRKDGSVVWTALSVRCLRNVAGEVEYFVALIQDISDRRRAGEALEKSRARFRAIIDASPVAMAINDDEGNITFVNPKFVETFGYTLAEVPTLAAWWPRAYPDPGYRQRVLADWQAALETTRRDGAAVGLPDHQMTGKDGTVRDIELTMAPMGPSHLVIFHDVTERKRAEEAVRELAEQRDVERRQLEVILSHLMQGVVVLDADGTIVWANPAALRLYGIASKAEVSPNFRDVETYYSNSDLNGEPIPFEELPAVRAFRGEVVTNFEMRVRRRDTGSESITSRSAVPIREASGAVTQVVVTITDIAERIRAEAALRDSERRFREMAEAMPQLVWTSDPVGQCDYVNRQWVEYTGLPEAEQLGVGWRKQLHPDDGERTTAGWQDAIRTGAVYDVEYRLRRADGVYHWFKTRAVPMRDADGVIVKWLGTSTDIEDQKRLEEEIRQFNVELAQRVGERTSQLQAAVQELEAFNYSVSHDLHAPLRHMDGFLGVLEEDYADELPDAARQCLDRVRAGSQRMGRMIEALLRLSRAGRADLQARRLDLTALPQAVFADLQKEERVRVIDFIVGPLPEVVADPTLVRQLVDNLLSNALKFTRPVAAARIELGCEHRNGEDVFYVRDNGVGFDAAKAKSIFGVFQRFHGADEFEGTGIGLSIVKRIVERHGGRVWVDSTPGEGATFWFTLGPPAPAA